jgi:hypothetical protein
VEFHYFKPLINRPAGLVWSLHETIQGF